MASFIPLWSSSTNTPTQRSGEEEKTILPKIKAQRIIMAASSPFSWSINTHSHPLIYLKGREAYIYQNGLFSFNCLLNLIFYKKLQEMIDWKSSLPHCPPQVLAIFVGRGKVCFLRGEADLFLAPRGGACIPDWHNILLYHHHCTMYRWCWWRQWWNWRMMTTTNSPTMTTTETSMTMITFRDSLPSELQLALAWPAPNPAAAAAAAHALYLCTADR